MLFVQDFPKSNGGSVQGVAGDRGFGAGNSDLYGGDLPVLRERDHHDGGYLHLHPRINPHC